MKNQRRCNDITFAIFSLIILVTLATFSILDSYKAECESDNRFEESYPISNVILGMVAVMTLILVCLGISACR